MLDLIIVLSFIAAVVWIAFGFFILIQYMRLAIPLGIISLLLSIMSLVMFYNDPVLSNLTVGNKALITTIMVSTWAICAFILFMPFDIDIITVISVPLFAVDITCIVFSIIVMPTYSYVKSSEYVKEITETTQIEKISDNLTSADGDSEIYLYSGYDITDKEMYTFYTKQTDDSYLQIVVPAEDAIVLPVEDGDTPHCNTVVRKWYAYNNNFDPPIKSNDPCETETTYEIYVPNGAISTSYSLDANF